MKTNKADLVLDKTSGTLIKQPLNMGQKDGNNFFDMTKEEKLKIFGENLKRLREQSGLTKKAVSACIGILPQQYYRYEDGLSEPGVTMALKLATLYGVDVQELFFGMENKSTHIATTVKKLNEMGIKSEVNLSGEISAEIIGSQPVHLPIEVMDALINETLETVNPTIKSSFRTELTKNYLLHLTGHK